MKKVLSIMLMAGMVSFYACGPSAADKEAAEKAEKAKTDSLAGVAKAQAVDSVNRINHAMDSVKNAEDAKMAGSKGGSSGAGAKQDAPKTDNTKQTVTPPVKKTATKRPGEK